MLGKIIARGADRESARRALVAALDDTAILGLTTNLGFLRALVAGDEFRDAAIDTAWLDTATIPPPGDDLARVFAAWADVAVLADPTDAGPFAPDGWRLAGDAAPVLVELDHVVRVDRAGHRVDETEVRAPPGPHPRRPPPRGGGRARAARHRGRPRGPPPGLRAAGRVRRPGRRGRGRHDRRADARHRARRPGGRRPARRRGRPAGGDGGDEDGARPQGAVRRHRRLFLVERDAEEEVA